MRVSILSSRDTLSNLVFTLSFNVTFGPPSRVLCYYNNRVPVSTFFNFRDHLHLSREVIRSQYTNSQPDITRVTVKVEQPMRVQRFYRCEVVVEGREHIGSGNYDYLRMGPTPDRFSSVTITGK